MMSHGGGDDERNAIARIAADKKLIFGKGRGRGEGGGGIVLLLILFGGMWRNSRVFVGHVTDAGSQRPGASQNRFSLTDRKSLSAPLHFFFLFFGWWLGGGRGGVGHLGWTEYCCARYDSVALCVRLLPQALIFPKQLYEAVFEEELTTIKIFVRLYGATLLSKLEKQNAPTQCVDIVPDVLTVNAARYTRAHSLFALHL